MSPLSLCDKLDPQSQHGRAVDHDNVLAGCSCFILSLLLRNRLLLRWLLGNCCLSCWRHSSLCSCFSLHSWLGGRNCLIIVCSTLPKHFNAEAVAKGRGRARAGWVGRGNNMQWVGRREGRPSSLETAIAATGVLHTEQHAYACLSSSVVSMELASSQLPFCVSAVHHCVGQSHATRCPSKLIIQG